MRDPELEEIAKEIQKRIDAHREFFKTTEEKLFAKIRRYFQGKFSEEEPQRNEAKADDDYACTKNIIFPLVDTALSAIIGNNPAVSATTADGQTSRDSLLATSNMAWVWRKNDMIRVLRVALTEALLCGRTVFKSGWDMDNDMPLARTVDVDAFYFDLDTKYQNDIRYKMECTPIPMKKFRRRRQKGLYKLLPPDQNVPGDVKPVWMGSSAHDKSARKAIDNVDEWVIVWEFYDLEEKKVYHYLESQRLVILADDLTYDPYVMYEMNFNGEDCRGLSEAMLIVSQQETINDLLTFWKNVVYLIVPRILYNAGLISEDDLNQVVSSALGAFVGVKVVGQGLPPNAWKDAFFQAPTPAMPREAIEFVGRVEDDAAYVSAVSQLSRGQQAGAKTATEVAVADQFNRNRTSSREGSFFNAVEKLAEKMWDLDRRKLVGERRIEVSKDGKKSKVVVDLQIIQSIEDVEWAWDAYNPIKNNPMVLAETLEKLLPVVMQGPYYDVYKYLQYLNGILGLPPDILKPEEEVRKMEEAAKQPPAPPQTPPGPPIDPNAIPPELMAQVGAQVPQGQGLPELPPEGAPIPGSVQAAAAQQGMIPQGAV
jgi:hypothetical protein